MSELLTQLASARAAAPHIMCACGHEAQDHEFMKCTASWCDCDIRRFEVEQGSVHYVDSDERVPLAEHLRRRRMSDTGRHGINPEP